jgi:hypothetical protein
MRRAEFYFAATIAVKSFRPKLNPPHRESRSEAAGQSHLYLPDAPVGAIGTSGRSSEMRHGEENPELPDMTRRFWIGSALALPVFFLAKAHLIRALDHG